MTPVLQDEIAETVARLPDRKKREVLEFARRLESTQRRGTPGSELLRFAGCIPRDDLALMSAAIEEGCEQIDTDAW